MKRVWILTAFLLISPAAQGSNPTLTVLFKKPQKCADAYRILARSEAVPVCEYGDPAPKRAYRADWQRSKGLAETLASLRKMTEIDSVGPAVSLKYPDP